MNILSLFDGMSCGRIALSRAGIKVDNYFASEIDKYAISIAQKNYPDTIQLGDVCSVEGSYITDIDLLIGGSPCQGFSRAGKGLNFDDSRSKLFFEYVRILKETKPKYFLLENVKMKQERQDIITEHLFGIEPIEINSTLVSAQNRRRLYWVGKLNNNGKYEKVLIKQPKDKGILLKDILLEEVEEKYYLSDNAKKTILKYSQNYIPNGKTPPLTVSGLAKSRDKNITPKIVKEIAFAKQLPMYQVPRGKNKGGVKMRTKSPTLSSNSWEYNNILCIKNTTKKGCTEGKVGILTTQQNWAVILPNMKLRRLTPIECERLQTVADNYTKGVSNTQRYKMLGNGWTVDVIAHIFRHFNF